MAYYSHGIILYGQVVGIREHDKCPTSYTVEEVSRYKFDDEEISEMGAINEELMFYTYIFIIDKDEIPKDITEVKEDILICEL